jgi:hypothetical protein
MESFGHEPTDLHTGVGGILGFAILIAVMVAVTQVILYPLHRYLAKQAEWPPVNDYATRLAQARSSALRASDKERSPLIALPPLQGTPAYPVYGPAEVFSRTAKEEELLSTYGGLSGSSERVRIPIRRAMELLVERGLNAQEEN